MKKVFQTIVDPGNGNCMQAAVASLLELEIEEVPHFLKTHPNPNYAMMKFLKEKGYSYCIWTVKYRNKNDKLSGYRLTKQILEVDGGIGGFFYASVKSQTFDGVSHAVIINKNMNIVHDPNPNQLCMKLTRDDILTLLQCQIIGT